MYSQFCRYAIYGKEWPSTLAAAKVAEGSWDNISNGKVCELRDGRLTMLNEQMNVTVIKP
jgi:hypothetical protein